MQNHSNLTPLVGRVRNNKTRPHNTEYVPPGLLLKDPGHFQNTNTQTPLLNVDLKKKKEQPGHLQNIHTQTPLLNVGLKKKKKQQDQFQNTHTQAPLLNVGPKKKYNTKYVPPSLRLKYRGHFQNTNTKTPFLNVDLKKKKEQPGHIQNTHSQTPLLNVGLNKKKKQRKRKLGQQEILDEQEKKPIHECPNLVVMSKTEGLEVNSVEKNIPKSCDQLTTKTKIPQSATLISKYQTIRKRQIEEDKHNLVAVEVHGVEKYSSQSFNQLTTETRHQTPSTSGITQSNQISPASQTALNRAGNMSNQTPSMSQTVRNSSGSYKSNQEYSKNNQKPAYKGQSSNEGNQGNKPNPKLGKKARKRKAKAIPTPAKIHGPSAPWMTDDIRELIRMKKEAHAQLRRDNTELNRKKLIFLAKTCVDHCQLARRKYEESLQKQKQNQRVAEEQKTSDVAPVLQESGGSVFSRLQPKQPGEELTAASEKRSELYSPTEECKEQTNDEDQPEVTDSDAGQRRMSAFDRLGPVTAKKPKLTINLSLDNEQAVREVVQETAYVPFHEREDVLASTNETVVKYLPVWPWKKTFNYKKTLTARSSKSVMLMEKEQVDEAYGRSNYYFLVSIKGYPPSWTKEDVLDVILANLKGKSFIPCFIEFSKDECKFLVNNSRMALLEIHSLGFLFRERDVELSVSISQLHLTVSHLQFLPKAVVRKLVEAGRDGTKLDLKAFTLQKDLSHFLYFPLNRIYNQRELVQNTCAFDWKNLTHLDLSHNKLKSLDGFNLPSYTPNLRSLDLSHNHIPTLPTLLSCRGTPLRSLWLEGNPLCLDVHRDSYVEAVRTMFSTLTELDGEPITLQGEMPKFWKNFCPYEAIPVVEKYLETFFPLLDSPHKDRIESMYDKNAVLTVTFRSKLRHDLDNIRCLRYLFLKCRIIEQKVYDYVRGATNIKNLIEKWPLMMHDPTTFTVDVLHHTDDTTLLKVVGVLKIVSDSLAEDEHLLVFSRTLLLHSSDGVEYTIKQEMLYWDEPEMGLVDSAFKLIRIQNKQLELKFDSTPDEKIQEELIEAFMKLTQLEAKPSRKCLEAKEWHFKNALEYFIKLLKLDNVGFLYKSNEN